LLLRLVPARAVPAVRGAVGWVVLAAHRGLVDVGVEGYLTVWTANAPGRQVDRANYEQLRERVVSEGLMSAQEVEAVLRLLEDPKFVVSAPLMLTAWGRKAVRDG
jgi:hypothetical protein